MNALHDGYTTDELSVPLGRRWSHDFGENVSYPLVVDGRVFVTTSGSGGPPYGSDLWALDEKTGETLWGPIALGGTYHVAGLTADSASVYTLTFDGFIQSIDQATGGVNWAHSLPDTSSFSGAPTVASGTLYAAGGDNRLFAVSTADGSLLWKKDTGSTGNTSPAVTDDGVYVSYACEVTIKMDPATGAYLWTHTTGCTGGGGTTPVVHDGRIYVRDNALMSPAVLSATDGTQVSAFSASRAPAFNDTTMFTLSAGVLRATDPVTQVVKWTQVADGQLQTAPLAIGDMVAVGSGSGRLYLFSAATGDVLWSADTGGTIPAPDEHNDVILTGMAEADDTLLVPSGTTLQAYMANDVSAAPTSVSFGKQRVGTYGLAKSITISNTGNTPEALNDIRLSGPNSADFFGGTNCFPVTKPRVLAPQTSCRVDVYAAPLAVGSRTANVVVTSSAAGGPDVVPLSVTGTEGYFLAGARGEVATFGDAVFHGDLTRLHLSAPIISVATTPNGAGYWMLGRDGGIFSFGNAQFYGSTGAMRLTKPIVGMTATPTGHGYWLVASDGGIFSFGDARFYGSAGGTHLRRPVVGMTTTATGHGYWLVADDGGVFAYGDAKFYGSGLGKTLSAPIARIVPTPTRSGYWLQGHDGHVYPFGDARLYGAVPPGRSIVGLTPTPDGHGYWTVSNTGQVYAFGNAYPYGSLPVAGVTDVIGIAATAPALPVVLIPFAAAKHASSELPVRRSGALQYR